MRGNVDDVDDVATFIKFTKKPERRACRHHSGRRNVSTETVCFDESHPLMVKHEALCSTDVKRTERRVKAPFSVQTKLM